MTVLVFALLVFFAVGVVFLFIHLMIGSFIRPAKPETEKLTIYECGEPTVGSAWVQFDLRYYVVALLFVIFDVEVAFFFPWAVVFGHANKLARPDLPAEERQVLSAQMMPTTGDGPAGQAKTYFPADDPVYAEKNRTITEDSARNWAWVAFLDIMVFFGVLMVGFAYLWRRGDINWVRSTAAEKTTAEPEGLPLHPPSGVLVGTK